MAPRTRQQAQGKAQPKLEDLPTTKTAGKKRKAAAAPQVDSQAAPQRDVMHDRNSSAQEVSAPQSLYMLHWTSGLSSFEPKSDRLSLAPSAGSCWPADASTAMSGRGGYAWLLLRNSTVCSQLQSVSRSVEDLAVRCLHVEVTPGVFKEPPDTLCLSRSSMSKS